MISISTLFGALNMQRLLEDGAMGKFISEMAFFKGASSGWSCVCPIFMAVKSYPRWPRCGALRLEELYAFPVFIQLFKATVPVNGVAVNEFDFNRAGGVQYEYNHAVM